MVVRELVALLGIKTDQKSQKKAEGGMDKLMAGAKKLAAAYIGLKSIQFAKDLILDVALLADEFGKMSTRTGIAAQTLQGLSHAAGLSGASLSDLDTGLKMLQKTQIEASDGLETYTREYKRLGVNIKNEDGTLKDSTVLLAEMADGFNDLETDAERTAVAMKLLGRSGTTLIPMLKQGSAGIKAMMAEVKDMGAEMDQKTIKAGERFIDQQGRMKLVFQSVKIAIARDFLPWANKGSESIIKWWKANKDWVRAGVVGTLKTFGSVFRAVGGVIKHVVTLFVDLWDSFSDGGKQITMVIGLIGLIGLALSTGPIGQLLLLGTMIGLIIDDFMVWREGGESAIGGIIKAIDDFLGIDIVAIIEEWGGAFIGMIRANIETMLSFVHFFVDIFEVGIGQAFENLVGRLKDIWGEWYESFKGPINKVVGFFKSVFGTIVTWFEKNVIHPIVQKINNSIAGKAFSFLTGNKLIDTTANDAEYGTSGPKKAFSGRASSGISGLSQSVTVNQTINAAPGMSEEGIARMVNKGVAQSIEKQNRDTLKAFVPQAAKAG